MNMYGWGLFLFLMINVGSQIQSLGMPKKGNYGWGDLVVAVIMTIVLWLALN